MALLARSQQLYAGALVLIAIEASGTSDASTKPASDNAAWLELGCVESLRHFMLQHVEEYSCPDSQLGWRDRKKTYNTGDRYEITSRETSSLHERLMKGLAGAITEGVAQTPGVAAERKLLAWVKIQTRMSDGNDNTVEDLWCEIRPMDPPPVEKGVQKPTLELWPLSNSLNAINYVDNS